MGKPESQKREIPKQALTTKEVAGAYGISEGHLANLRSRRAGPRFYKMGPGRKVLYKPADVEAWLFSNPVQTVDSHRETGR